MTDISGVPPPVVPAVFRPALVLMSGRLLGFVAAFAIPMVLARVFEQAEFGTYKQTFLLFATLFGIAQLGMAESLYYFLPSGARRSGAYVFNALVVLGIMGGLSFLLLVGFRYQIAQLLNNSDLVQYMPLLGIYLSLMLMAVVLEILLTIRRQHWAASCSYALSDLARALCYISPVLIFANLRMLMFGAIGFALLRFGAMLVYVWRDFGRQLVLHRAALATHLAYAVPFGIAGLIEVVQINYHLYVVSFYFGAATFAIYAVGCLQIPLTDFLMTSTCNVMMVNMQEKIKANDDAAIAAIWLDSVRKLALIFFPLVVLLIVVAQPLIITLFSERYAESVPIFVVWTISMLFATLLTDGVLRVFAQTHFLIFQNLIRLGIVVALIPWFLASFDLLGAIFVSLLAIVVSKVCALLRLRVLMSVSFAQLLPWPSLARALLIAAAAAIPALAIMPLFSTPNVAQLAVASVIYVLTYYVFIRQYGPMPDDEKQLLAQWFSAPFISLRTRFSMYLRS